MFYAKERRTEKIVSAENASLYGKYRCPTCRAEVFLKRGKVYRNHFAHMPGQGKPECEDYHHSEELRRQWQTSVPEQTDLPVEGLLLSIELEPNSEMRGPRKWGLRLTVPKSHDGHGEIRIDLGGGDVRKIPLAALLLGSRSYRAYLAAPDFGAVWISPDVPPAYRAAVVHRIAGLSPQLVNIFTAVPHKQKPQANVLRWGDSYYFVWRNDVPIVFPQSLEQRALAENHGWSCSLTALPDRPDPDVAAWLAQVSDLQIARAKREWALVYPPPYAVDDDGDMLVSSTSKLLLAVKPVDNEQGAEITSQVGQQSRALKLSGSIRNFIHITVSDPESGRRVQLAWNSMPLNSLAPKPYPKTIEPGVWLEFEAGASRTGAMLHLATCAALLAEVRRGENRLSAVRAPAVLRGELRSRRAGELDWKQLELAFTLPSERAASMSGELLARINDAIQDPQCDVILDFGAFGSFSARALPQPKTRPAAAFRIPRDLRARIEWLCKASGVFVDRQRRPINVLDDAALIRHYSSILPPMWLTSHYRFLEHQLTKWRRRNE